jgi:hypothetical protein
MHQPPLPLLVSFNPTALAGNGQLAGHMQAAAGGAGGGGGVGGGAGGGDQTFEGFTFVDRYT